jgi:hypothetical protein
MATGVTSDEPRSIRSWYGSTLVTMLRTTTSPGPGGRSGRRSGTRSPGRSEGPGRQCRTMTSAWLGTDMSKALCLRTRALWGGGLSQLSSISRTGHLLVWCWDHGRAPGGLRAQARPCARPTAHCVAARVRVGRRQGQRRHRPGRRAGAAHPVWRWGARDPRSAGVPRRRPLTIAPRCNRLLRTQLRRGPPPQHRRSLAVRTLGEHAGDRRVTADHPPPPGDRLCAPGLRR